MVPRRQEDATTTTASLAPDKPMILLNGGTVTRAAVPSAEDVLETSAGYKVREPLAAAGNPLASSNYRSIAQQLDPERKLAEPMGSAPGRNMNTKPAFLAYLRQVLAESA